MKLPKLISRDSMESKIGGVRCILINGRWVRIKDHKPYEGVKQKGTHNV